MIRMRWRVMCPCSAPFGAALVPSGRIDDLSAANHRRHFVQEVVVLPCALDRVLDRLDMPGLPPVQPREVDRAVQEHVRDHVQDLVPFWHVQPLIVDADERGGRLQVVEPQVPARAQVAL